MYASVCFCPHVYEDFGNLVNIPLIEPYSQTLKLFLKPNLSYRTQEDVLEKEGERAR